MIIGTAGHVDHGKTALVHALTGMDTDRLAEEKRRGITIELGFAPLTIPGAGVVGVVDVPGHEDFVRMMVAGAAGIDLALLVIAADEGVMPQTREHLAVLGALGVTRGIVAVTKVDLVDDEWRALLHDDLEAALAGTALAAAPRVDVSVRSGHGVDTLRETIAQMVRNSGARDDRDVMRMPIDRVFAKPGAGTIVTGTMWSGRTAPGDSVRVLPSGVAGRVRGLQVHGDTVEGVGAGHRVAISLTGVRRDQVRRGDVLVGDAPWPVTRCMLADVELFPDAGTLAARTPLRLHLGTAEHAARVVCAGGPLQAGERRAARVVVAEPGVVARAGDRFVLRRASPAATIGAGVVTDAGPVHRRTRPFSAVGLAAAQRAALVVDAAGVDGVDSGSVPFRFGTAVDQLTGNGAIVGIGGRVVAARHLPDIARQIGAIVDRTHAESPLEPGAALAQLRGAVRAPPDVVAHVLAALERDGELIVRDAHVMRPGWNPQASAAVSAGRDAVLEHFSAAGTQPPTVADIERAWGPQARAYIRELVSRGSLIPYGRDQYAAASAAEAVIAVAKSSATAGRAYTASELREMFGMTRKYLIPWLEYLDRVGITRRDGDVRFFAPDSGAGSGRRPEGPGWAPPPGSAPSR